MKGIRTLESLMMAVGCLCIAACTPKAPAPLSTAMAMREEMCQTKDYVAVLRKYATADSAAQLDKLSSLASATEGQEGLHKSAGSFCQPSTVNPAEEDEQALISCLSGDQTSMMVFMLEQGQCKVRMR